MKATAAVADLLKTDLVWRRFFKRCCDIGTLRLRAQAWQFRTGLAERGIKADLEDVRAALLVIAAKTLPNTPAGREAAGISDWREHLMACECQDCSAGTPRHASTGRTVVQMPKEAFDLAREYFGPAAEKDEAS